MQLPLHFDPYTDKYFLRSLEILRKEKFNPFVRVQIFLRDAGLIYGLKSAVALIDKFSLLRKNGGKIYSLEEGTNYSPQESVMLIEARVQDIIYLETLLLSLISSQTTERNDKTTPDLAAIQKNFHSIKALVNKRPFIYFGARHYRYDQDKAIAQAAFSEGAAGAATDNEASVIQKKGVGTIPHALECIFAWKYERENAVLKTIEAFDKHMDVVIPRIALIDFNNKEIDDSLAVAEALQDRLYGIRVDTSGENTMQGEHVFPNHTNEPYWSGLGITIGGVYALRQQLLKHDFSKVKIILSSGFGEVGKVKAFVEAEKELGISLFDELGIGQVSPVRAATMDIVNVGESIKTMEPMAKAGRAYHPNSRLHEV
jgi:nicotinate phosphoribosyltransferase